ncbi:hypothetical protein MT325_m067L [Paramecium bursaria chlorella virus MT325]|uniref:Uncharacterized protein m067L n=1 Tax=Paramecium bursaria Chlorella virus MT325 TaxID=346932 RepID=A7ITE7_PBCVM|nr:hypothetical protein MT325_m067L [Paramecium bursaria chlorella virus MT325]
MKRRYTYISTKSQNTKSYTLATLAAPQNPSPTTLYTLSLAGPKCIVAEVGGTAAMPPGPGACPLKLLTVIDELISYDNAYTSPFARRPVAAVPFNVRFVKFAHPIVRTEVLFPGTFTVVHILKLAVVPYCLNDVSVVVPIMEL